jgi:hypothetical protein
VGVEAGAIVSKPSKRVKLTDTFVGRKIQLREGRKNAINSLKQIVKTMKKEERKHITKNRKQHF